MVPHAPMVSVENQTMKADIDERGCLRVTPETPLERYALGMWWVGWNRDAGAQSSTLMLNLELKPKEDSNDPPG